MTPAPQNFKQSQYQMNQVHYQSTPVPYQTTPDPYRNKAYEYTAFPEQDILKEYKKTAKEAYRYPNQNDVHVDYPRKKGSITFVDDLIEEKNEAFLLQPFQSNKNNIPDRTVVPAAKEVSFSKPVAVGKPRKEGKRKLEKTDALQRLMAIAGEDWEADIMLQGGRPVEKDFQCPKEEGHYPDPGNCSAYYQCAQGVGHRRTCEPGLRWDMRSNKCDWAENVVCRL